MLFVCCSFVCFCDFFYLSPCFPLAQENCHSTHSSQSDSQYGSPPRGWSEELDEHGHTFYVSELTQEKVFEHATVMIVVYLFGFSWILIGVCVYSGSDISMNKADLITTVLTDPNLNGSCQM